MTYAKFLTNSSQKYYFMPVKLCSSAFIADSNKKWEQIFYASMVQSGLTNSNKKKERFKDNDWTAVKKQPVSKDKTLKDLQKD